MSSKINPLKIIKAHLSTLKDSEGKSSFWDVFLFLIFPFLLSFSVVYKLVIFDSNMISLLLNFGAIFTALLLSLLVMVYDQESKLPKVESEKKDLKLAVRARTLRELYHNISFSIFTSILIVTFCFLLTIAIPFNVVFLSNTLEWILMFLSVNLVLTILMVLKRMHSLLVLKG